MSPTQKSKLKVSPQKWVYIFSVNEQIKVEGSVSVKKEPAPVKQEQREAGKKRTHRQMKASKFLDVEAKEEESDEDHRRTTKSEVKQESGK